MPLKTYSTKPRKQSRKKLLIGVILVVLLVILAITAIWYFQKLKVDEAAKTQKTRDEAQTSSSKKDIQEADETAPSEPNKVAGSNLTSDAVQRDPALTATTRDFRQENGTISVRGEVQGTNSSGTCVFTFSTDDAKPVIRQVNDSPGTCQIEIPEVEFTKLGAWQLTFTFYTNDKKAEASQNVTIL